MRPKPRKINVKSPFVRKALRPRFNGIFYAADVLAVTPQHLRMVLIGERQSLRLMEKVRCQFPGLLAQAKRSA